MMAEQWITARASINNKQPTTGTARTHSAELVIRQLCRNVKNYFTRRRRIVRRSRTLIALQSAKEAEMRLRIYLNTTANTNNPVSYLIIILLIIIINTVSKEGITVAHGPIWLKLFTASLLQAERPGITESIKMEQK